MNVFLNSNLNFDGPKLSENKKKPAVLIVIFYWLPTQFRKLDRFVSKWENSGSN